MNLRGRVAALDKIIPPLPVPKPEDMAGDALVALLFEAMEAVALTDEEADRVLPIVQAEDYRNPLVAWAEAIRKGRCRVPEISPAVIGEIMLAYAALSRPEAMVCNACGMLLPREFGPCPICGGEQANRSRPGSSSSARWLGMDRHVGAIISAPRSPR